MTTAFKNFWRKNLLKITGRSEGPGRPLLYSTSEKFMDYFGLKSIQDLPKTRDISSAQSSIGDEVIEEKCSTCHCGKSRRRGIIYIEYIIMEGPLINRVAKSGLITINLESFYPEKDIKLLDIKDFLFMEMILKEKDFREALKKKDWTAYQDSVLLIFCSTDAIIPVWAYMLISSYAEDHASDIYQGNLKEYLTHYYHEAIAQMDIESYKEKRIVIKGCSDKPVPAGAYQALTQRLKISRPEYHVWRTL